MSDETAVEEPSETPEAPPVEAPEDPPAETPEDDAPDADALERLERRVSALEEVFTSILAGDVAPADPVRESFLRHKEKARRLAGG